MLHARSLIRGSYIQMGHFSLRSEGVPHGYRIYNQNGSRLNRYEQRFPSFSSLLLILAASPSRWEYHPDLSPGRSDVKRWLS